MEKTFSPIIITAKKARKHIEKIKAHHADIIQNLEAHKLKVQAFHEKKAAEQAQKDQTMIEHHKMMSEAQAKQREMEMAHQKEMSMNAVKEKELEIKRRALEHANAD